MPSTLAFSYPKLYLESFASDGTSTLLSKGHLKNARELIVSSFPIALKFTFERTLQFSNADVPIDEMLFGKTISLRLSQK